MGKVKTWGGVAMSRKEKALDRANPGQKKIQAAGLDKFIFNSSVMRKSQAILAGYVLSCLIEILYWMNWPKWKFASRLVDRLTVILEGQP